MLKTSHLHPNMHELTKLKKLNNGKSPGTDGIHPRTRPLRSYIFSTRYQIQKVARRRSPPSRMEIGNASPIFRKDNMRSPANYKQVNLTLTASKVILYLFRTLSSCRSNNYRPSAPFLYEVASHVNNCHSGHYSY